MCTGAWAGSGTATSDIDVLAVTGCRPDGPALDRLTALQRNRARRGGACARLNCLYVPDETLADPEARQVYWYGDQFTEWQLKVMTLAGLGSSGWALYGPWPPPGLPEISSGDLRAHTRDQLAGYWRRLTYRPRIWLQDKWVDFALVTLARSGAVIHDGALITKSQAITRPADFGVPPSLADQNRRRPLCRQS